MNGIKYVRPGNGFVPNFPLFEKRDVNGEKEQEIYTFFKVSSIFIYLFLYFVLSKIENLNEMVSICFAYASVLHVKGRILFS